MMVWHSKERNEITMIKGKKKKEEEEEQNKKEDMSGRYIGYFHC